MLNPRHFAHTLGQIQHEIAQFRSVEYISGIIAVVKMTLKAFKVVTVPMGNVTHQLFLKEHSEGLSGGVLFVGNVDLTFGMSYADIDGYLRDLLRGFGDIKGVSVSSSRKDREDKGKKRALDDDAEGDEGDDLNYGTHGIEGLTNITSMRTRFAHVQFTKQKAVANCLKAAKNGDIDAAAEAVGKKWNSMFENLSKKSKKEIAAAFKWRDCGTIEDMKEEVDSYMKDFEEEEEKERLEKIRKSKEMDDDGFMPVRTKHKTRKTTDKGSSRSSGNARSRGEKKSKELKNFYRFQMREEKRETLQSLREQFEKDKERVARMKADRKFSPFS
jgi:hypothetical protein